MHMTKSNMINNHIAPTLSDLDLKIVTSVPPGGNWKNIPESIPSKRIQQIRESYAAGKGSRSTYYGRLKYDAPSYTITTYYNRPGNGCHIHPDYDGGQHRVISHREAARFQSFPDSFKFLGNQGSILKQIGNAVPPLLSYQIARSLGKVGTAADIFSGAGGLAMGFHWSGWNIPVAIDIDSSFLETNKANLNPETHALDLSDSDQLESAIRIIKNAFASGTGPYVVLGGPPCQGFSTAGNRRSMNDARNHLFKSYASILRETHPDFFVFENVLGLKSMQGGEILAQIIDEFQSIGFDVDLWDIKTQYYAVPQRRRRLFLVGSQSEKWKQPEPLITDEPQIFQSDSGSHFVTVMDAIGDLPPLVPGEDGTGKDYIKPSENSYQMLMRGSIQCDEYVNLFRSIQNA